MTRIRFEWADVRSTDFDGISADGLYDCGCSGCRRAQEAWYALNGLRGLSLVVCS